MKTIAVVILNWNGCADTLDCLKSLYKPLSLSFQLITIIVDNASSDQSVEKIQSQFPHAILLKNKKNLGFSGGNNVGVNHALSLNADYIFLLNNDTTISSTTIEELVSSMEKFPRWGIAAPKIYFAKGFEFYTSRYQNNDRGKVLWYAGGLIDWTHVMGRHRGVDEIDTGQYDTPSETDYASGCALLVRSSVIKKIGLLDNRYFLYYEDLDFNMRVKRAGFKIGFYPQSFLWHKNAGSSSSGSALQDYYITRNRMLFGLQYAPVKSKLALIKESVSLFTNGRLWQKQGVIDFYLHRFGKGSYAV